MTDDARTGAAERKPAVGGATVLLVDSDEEFREALTERLGRLVCTLECVSHDVDLRETLESVTPVVLVLSSDGPGVNAVDIVTDLRAQPRWARLPIFMVGRRLGNEASLRAYGAGADAVLSKTRAMGLTELAARIGGVVRSARDETPETGDAAPADPTDEAVPDVIVIEDDPALVEMLDYALSNQGYQLVFYANGREALDGLLAMRTGDQRPVVLLDVDLPGMDGFRVLQELSDARPGDFQVIMATMHSSEAAQVLAIESGALDYIVKPMSIPITIAKVERLIQAGAVQ